MQLTTGLEERSWRVWDSVPVLVCVRVWWLLLKVFHLQQPRFSVCLRLQLHGHRPGFHTTVSPTWPQSPLSLSISLPLWHGFLFSVSCPLPYPPTNTTLQLPSIQSFVLFVRFPWPTNKSSGRGTVEQFMAPVWSSFSWPQCSHSPLVCASSCVMEQKEEGNEDK